ncbi:hypothetical protein GOP47_0012223 [Adiantum capillus-veneris]|uniref:Uncharacterized protein n=1 Tax=Adiantum capillus-veneris TaxID=13818 RepID=A0A9D4URB6_ADICA|nr:hypothetical protein GOP47_0012223 [Adiantum capillus-veneris]
MQPALFKVKATYSFDLNVTWQEEEAMKSKMDGPIPDLNEGIEVSSESDSDSSQDSEDLMGFNTGWLNEGNSSSADHPEAGAQLTQKQPCGASNGDSIHMFKPRIMSPDPSLHLSHHYFSFDRASYDLMLQDMKGICNPSLATLREVGVHDKKRWNSMKDNVCIRGPEHDGSTKLFLKMPLLAIAPDEHAAIIEECHIDPQGAHLGMSKSIDIVKSEWCTDVRKHGIPISFIRDMIRSCKVCNKGPTLPPQSLMSKLPPQLLMSNKVEGKLNADENNPSVKILTDKAHVNDALESIALKRKVRLVKIRSAQVSFGKVEDIYICHRGGSRRYRGGDKRRERKTKKCGCLFKTRVQFKEVDEVSIVLHAQHHGHVPGSRLDLYYLPVHPRVLHRCMEDYFDVGTSRHVAKMSVSKQNFHMQQVPPVDCVTFRFFMIPKEVRQLAYSLQLQGSTFHYLCSQPI